MLRILRDEKKGSRSILQLQGRIVAEWAGLLEAECLDLLRAGYRVVLDLSRVDFVGRHGVVALQRLDRRGVRIGGCSTPVAEVLRQAGIRAILRVGERRDKVVPWTPIDGSGE